MSQLLPPGFPVANTLGVNRGLQPAVFIGSRNEATAQGVTDTLDIRVITRDQTQVAFRMRLI
jgi:hypothetical protein